MAIKINSRNLNKRRKINLLKTGRIARMVLRGLGAKEAELNIIFCSNQKIRAFNRQYLGIDASTDVIAFPPDKRMRIPGITRRFLGDIAISSDKAAENSARYGTTKGVETALYIIHGILHLSGYRDGTKAEKNIIRKKENEILRKIAKIL